MAPKITKSVTCPDELGALASQVTGDYSQLAVQGRLAAHTAEPEEVRLSWAMPRVSLFLTITRIVRPITHHRHRDTELFFMAPRINGLQPLGFLFFHKNKDGAHFNCTVCQSDRFPD